MCIVVLSSIPAFFFKLLNWMAKLLLPLPQWSKPPQTYSIPTNFMKMELWIERGILIPTEWEASVEINCIIQTPENPSWGKDWENEHLLVLPFVYLFAEFIVISSFLYK